MSTRQDGRRSTRSRKTDAVVRELLSDDGTVVEYGRTVEQNAAGGGMAQSESAELSALITERCFWSLDAPVRRLASLEVPIPYARHLEQHAIPQVDDIVAAARRLLDTGR